ncbi:MAG TPA: hypothetical protein HPP87_07165 [Planctomycetes bacterium]|nr:hypothetical protein [Planctomycetota bacterium]
MGVHLDGNGSTWTGIESLDVDEPIGLSYRQLNHLSIAVRKRIGFEHVTFADSTVGGKHLPGGARILGIVENTTDLSKGYGDASYDITTGKFMGRGLVYDQTNNALWCATGDGTVSDDPYLITLHPDRIWNGGDVTWAGAHEFDGTVDFTSHVNIDGTLQTDSLVVDGTEVDLGGTAGISLFFDPTVYAGGESSTRPDGMIIKHGTLTVASNPDDVSFAVAFPNSLEGLAVAPEHSTNPQYYLTASGKTGFTGIGAAAQPTKVHWVAIGR